MQQFKDCEGRDWVIKINTGVVKRVLSLTKERDGGAVNLLAIADVASRLASDPVLLVDVLFIICKEEADKRGVTDEQFGIGFAGDVIGNATNAFMQEWASFFPQPQRGLILKMLSAVTEITEREIASATAKFEEKMKELSQPPPAGNSSTTAPGSVESTQTP